MQLTVSAMAVLKPKSARQWTASIQERPGDGRRSYGRVKKVRTSITLSNPPGGRFTERSVEMGPLANGGHGPESDNPVGPYIHPRRAR